MRRFVCVLLGVCLLSAGCMDAPAHSFPAQPIQKRHDFRVRIPQAPEAAPHTFVIPLQQLETVDPPLSLIIDRPVAGAAAAPLTVDVYTAETTAGQFSHLQGAEFQAAIGQWRKKHPEAHSTWCKVCNVFWKTAGEGDDRIRVVWRDEPAPSGPDSYPAIRWHTEAGKLMYATTTPESIDALFEMVAQTNDISEPVSSAPPVMFGRPYVELQQGRTTVRHLQIVHGLTADQLAPYLHDQDALDRIHGWQHSGEGELPSRVKLQGKRQRWEPRAAAAGRAGAIRGRAKIKQGLEWIRTNVGENVKAGFRWDRTGAQTFPLWHNQNFSAIAVLGASGRFELSAPGSKLKVPGGGFAYTVRGKDLHIDLDPVVFVGLAESLFGPAPTMVNAQEKVSVDPFTVWTVLSIFRTVWSLLHPSADLQLGGNVSATAMLQGDTLGIDFQQMPQIRLVWIFTFRLGVRRVEITPTAVRILFTGSRFIQERSFEITD